MYLSLYFEPNYITGLSMLHSNPCMAEEVWEVLQLYPYEYRWGGVFFFSIYWHELKTLNYITKLIMFSHNCVVRHEYR